MPSLRFAILALAFVPTAFAAGPEAFDSDRFGISLRRPSAEWTWKIPEVQTAEGGAKLGSVNGTSAFQLLAKLNREIKPEDPAIANVTLDCFPQSGGDDDPVAQTRTFTDAMRPHDANYSLLEPARAISVGGHRAARAELEVTLRRTDADGARVQYPAHVRAWFIPVDGYWVRLIVSTQRESWAGVAAEFEKVAESIQFRAAEAKAPEPAAKVAPESPLDGLKF